MAKSSKGNVRLTTALTWKRIIDPDDKWLTIEHNAAELVTKIKCRICKKYKHKLRSNRNFNESYAIGIERSGIKKDNLIKHGKSEQHTRGMAMEHWASQHVSAPRASTVQRERRPEMEQFEATSSETKLVPVETMMAVVDKEEQRVTRLIEIAYSMVKEDIPFKSFPALIDMEACHGLVLGDTFTDAKSCQHFVECIGKYLLDDFVQLLKQVRYFSILIDVFVNSSKKDVTALLYIVFVDPQTGELATHYLKHAVLPTSVNKDDFRSLIESTMAEFGVENFESRLVGVGTNQDRSFSIDVGLDGESQLVPWLVASVCFEHRLEVSVKQSLTGSNTYMYVDVIMSTFSDLFASFRNTRNLPDELTELKSVLEELQLDDDEGVRWVQITFTACQLLTRDYKSLVTWLESVLDTDPRASSILSTVKHFRFVGTIMFLTHLLHPLVQFCSQLQNSSSSFSRVLSAVSHTILDSLEALMKNCLPPGSNLQLLVSNRLDNETPLKCHYMGVELHDAYFGIETLFRNFILRVESCLRPHLYIEGHEKIFKCAQILDTKLWPPKIIDLHNFGCGLLQDATNHFYELLHYKSEDILSEWNMFKMFAMQCLFPASSDEIWSKLNVQHKEDYPKLSSLIEVLRVFPHSPSTLRDCYLTFRTAKTDWRAVFADDTIDSLLRIKFNGPPCHAFNSYAVTGLFFGKTGTTESLEPSSDFKPESGSPSVSGETSSDVKPDRVENYSEETMGDAPSIKTECDTVSEEELTTKRIKLECDSD